MLDSNLTRMNILTPVPNSFECEVNKNLTSSEAEPWMKNLPSFTNFYYKTYLYQWYVKNVLVQENETITKMTLTAFSEMLNARVLPLGYTFESLGEAKWGLYGRPFESQLVYMACTQEISLYDMIIAFYNALPETPSGIIWQCPEPDFAEENILKATKTVQRGAKQGFYSWIGELQMVVPLRSNMFDDKQVNIDVLEERYNEYFFMKHCIHSFYDHDDTDYYIIDGSYEDIVHFDNRVEAVNEKTAKFVSRHVLMTYLNEKGFKF